MDESVESWLPAVERLAFWFVGSGSYLLGDVRPPATDEERGGSSGPPNDGLSPLEDTRVLAERGCCASSTSPELPTLTCRGLPPDPLSDPSLPEVVEACLRRFLAQRLFQYATKEFGNISEVICVNANSIEGSRRYVELVAQTYVHVRDLALGGGPARP
ncbi:actin-interacting protein Bud6 Aip3 [Pyrenophora tritici-repentis]|nr:actin-interacting protein Bud6 Aip3 [Pyrenophora tritici-repentis]KAI1556387.1 actin-interacting protein Bud6 Aip3 [Pyrenophora tritici-repentis]PWO23462.1 hypothetical protein PtrARCrB10_08000 [Pyrenophora tritici-repentis]